MLRWAARLGGGRCILAIPCAPRSAHNAGEAAPVRGHGYPAVRKKVAAPCAPPQRL
jgi:hypothetical protein